VQAVIDSNNVITAQQLSLTLTGQDANGTSHELSVKAQIQLSQPNGTTPDTVDLSGKQVQQAKHGRGDHREG